MLGPSQDGGFYLVGSSQPQPELMQVLGLPCCLVPGLRSVKLTSMVLLGRRQRFRQQQPLSSPAVPQHACNPGLLQA